MKTIYIAAPWKRKKEAAEAREALVAAGFVVTSRWIDVPDGASDLEEQAENDLLDLLRADILVYLNLQKSEGKATELGFAMCAGHSIYVVGGKQNNVFLNLSKRLTHVKSVEEVIAKLTEKGGQTTDLHEGRSAA